MTKMARRSSRPSGFWAFVENIERLRTAANLTSTSAELDAYLWLAGLYLAWEPKQEKAMINAEASRFFETAYDEVRIWLPTRKPGATSGSD